MTITKILEATLVAGQSVVTFTDAEIPNSILRVYPSDSDLIYESISLVSTTLTVTYPVQTANKSIALEIIKAGLDVIDNLTSTDTDNALSAKQGKTLNDAIVLVSGNLDTLTETVNNLDIPESITDLSDVNVTSIEDGQVLAWDDVSQKFVNVNQSGDSSDDYSTSETVLGKWIDNATIYRCVFDLTTDTNISSTSWHASGINIANLSKITSCFGVNSSGTYYPLMAYHSSGAINLLACRDGANANVRYICIEYTKTS